MAKKKSRRDGRVVTGISWERWMLTAITLKAKSLGLSRSAVVAQAVHDFLLADDEPRRVTH
jgi:hypothetical protein